MRKKAVIAVEAVTYPKIECPSKTSEFFGENTFSLKLMEQMLPSKTFKAFKNWMSTGHMITEEQADEIAAAMKSWAISKGASHYTHWFQPLTGLTAEKHDAFIDPVAPGVVMEKFSGSKLIQGEPDASSFPSGGIRSTFEARGYTAWDPSSPAFLIETELGKTLCIPTIFVSYHGEALDKKLPLLRSDEAIDKAARRLFAIFGKNAKKVYSTCGAEQEYFLIDEKFYKMRQDIMLTGRSLIGAPSPKGQQLEDQYFGSIKDRVLNYMVDVGNQAAKLGIPVKTRHNEVAPAQYEFAPVFEESNLAADHNILLMDIMKKTASKHGLVCLLHEKPFAGVNGSGKHLNWSMSDDSGSNLLEPGKTPHENLFFLAVLVAVLRAVYRHADLLRASVAKAGNEHRLGANEAPPAIVSVFLGDTLSEILDHIETGKKKTFSTTDILDLGLTRLPKFSKDATDRNRTSPFAFTGNKFEFRAVGSSQNVSTPIMVVNTIVAESMDYVAEQIEKAKASADFDTAVMKVVADLIKETKNIRFEGDNYSQAWRDEAAKRGLPSEASAVKALAAWKTPKAVELFTKYKVLSEEELHSRYHIWVENYNTLLAIEANTLYELVDADVLPAGYKYEKLLAKNLYLLCELQKSAGLKLNDEAMENHKEHLSDIVTKIWYVRKHLMAMKALLKSSAHVEGAEKSMIYFNELKPLMAHIRKHSDELEQVVSDQEWVLPKYREMLFVC
ncbi:MAG: glutamine synthetase [Planctomycetes bacterium GWF2_50_10]|nr:MAG: glutamine synthetase [Planctomycetes bacterium GWF2_50_10]